ncbi:hypothetical protein HanIR_Chr08g0356161 [Helianthus annuus]|nr:hypothetical protein HanIR_Chr08g0356161 [Helianthus annuus]
MATTSSSVFLLSRFTDLPPLHHHQPPSYSHHLLICPLLSPSFSAITKKRHGSMTDDRRR